MTAPTSTMPPAVRDDAPIARTRSAAGWIAGLVARRRWIGLAVLAVAGVVVFSPALRSEFLLDDYLHASMIDGTYPVHRSPLDLYDFVGDGERSVLVDRGMLPWWSHPDLRIRFLRPLASVLRWAEQRAFGRGALLPHLHSLLWWMAAVLAARRLYRRLLSPRAAALATAVFALSPCHTLPIGWLANREALISVTFGALALTSYLQWREGSRGSARHAVAACGLFALSLSAGEYALGLGAYVLAFELLGETPPASTWTARVGRLLAGIAPFALPAAAYLGLRAVLGYGTRGSSFYDDPLHEPLAFLAIAPRRLAALVSQEWLTIDADEGTSPWLYASYAVVVAALAYVPLRYTFASLDVATRKRARSLFVGSTLALVPVLSVDPSPRVLGAAMLGLAPVLALVMDVAWFATPSPERRPAAEMTGLVALGIGFAQLVHAPVTAWMIGERYRRISVDFVAAMADLSDRIRERGTEELVVLRGGPTSFFVPFALVENGTMPARWRVLSTTGHALGLRPAADALELVVPKDSTMLYSSDLFRNSGLTFRPGQAVEMPGLRVTIVELGSEGPRRARFDFDWDLDDPRALFVTESSKGAFPDAKLPRPGFGQPYDP